MPQQMIGGIRLHQPKWVLLRKLALRHYVRRPFIRDLIVDAQRIGQLPGVSRAGWRMLILCSYEQRKRSPLLGRRSPGDSIQAGLIRPSVVVADRLSQMVAVPQYRTADPQEPRI